jgi:hypothetical protein
VRNPENEWASVAQAAEALGVSKVNVYDKVARGLVPVATVGKTTLVSRRWLDLAAGLRRDIASPRNCRAPVFDWDRALDLFREVGDDAA